jgi:TetR/AcrR family transcriptional regulator
MARFDSAQRAKILEAAIPIFADKGLEGTAIRLVGRAAGVNSALLYYYFENKHTLFAAAIRQVMRGFLDHLAQPPALKSGRDRIAFLINSIFDYYGAHPPRMKLMAITIVLHADLMGQVISGFVKEQSLLPLQILQEGMVRRELKPMNPVQMWWSILGAGMFSLQMREVVRHADMARAPFPIPSLELAREQIIELLANGLGVKTIGRKGVK